MHRNQNAPACNATGSDRNLKQISYNAPMHFRHRPTDTDIVS